MRFLCTSGGLGRFMPCRDWGQSLYVEAYRLGKVWTWGYLLAWGTSSVAFLNEIVVLFRYRPNSAAALLEGVLPLMYSTARSAGKVPTWRLEGVRRLAPFA